MSNKSTENKEIDDKECFVIMPISDDPSHPEGHFLRVYEDIIKPACENAGFIANRADDDNASNLIHLSILNKLIKAPIAICDLSTRNPNVLFELGIRQAFNKPVVLIQERGTPKIFDISPLRYLEYSNDLKYRDVIKAQEDIKNMIIETIGDKNSIVNLLSIQSPAELPKSKPPSETMLFDIFDSEMQSIRRELRNIQRMISSQREIPFLQKRLFPLVDDTNERIEKYSFIDKLRTKYLYIKNRPMEIQEKLIKYRELIQEAEIIKKEYPFLREQVERIIMMINKEIDLMDLFN